MRQVIGQVVVENGTVRLVRLDADGVPVPSAASGLEVPRHGAALRELVQRFRRRVVRETLERHEGNIHATARALGMTRRGLQMLLRREAIRRFTP